MINQKQGLIDAIQSLDTLVHQVGQYHSFESNQCKLKYIDLQILGIVPIKKLLNRYSNINETNSYARIIYLFMLQQINIIVKQLKKFIVQDGNKITGLFNK